MPIPKNIYREHILKAIKYIDENGVPPKRESTRYDLHYNNKLYPPKYVISRANVFANGEELYEFNGGDETNNVLKNMGFEVLVLQNNGRIPPLEPKLRTREYESYSDAIRDRVVFDYLFNSRTHRWLDEHIIGLNSNESRGYQSMGILHYIGLRDKHKGIFRDTSLSTGIEQLHKANDDFTLVITSLKRTLGVGSSSNENTNKVSGEARKIEYKEGKELLELHKVYERDPQLIKDAKKRFKKMNGELYCEACGINFEKMYGERGKDYIEGHHKKPVSKMKEGETTKIEDIGMLCSNCHRMIHRFPMVSIEELKKSLRMKWI
ncbi:HNH endonuclease [Paenibacillus tundrae]